MKLGDRVKFRKSLVKTGDSVIFGYMTEDQEKELERLELIKSREKDAMYLLRGTMIRSDWYWLIEQAERALKNAEDLEDMDRQLASEQRRIRELKEENQRYKQALEFYADPMIWREGNRIKGNTFEMPLANNDNGHKARKALECDDD